MACEERLECLTRRIGREVFARVSEIRPLPLGPTWWDDRLMELSMGDEAVKVQLFRFVDVLPQLDTPPAIVRHLREYFAEVQGRLPPGARLGLRLLPQSGLLGRLLARLVRWSTRRLARKFIAGSNVGEAVLAVRGLRRQSLAFTMDLLGEATVTEEEADHAQAEYLQLLRGLSAQVARMPACPLIDADDAGPIPRVNVSVKLSALYSQFDPIDPEGTSRCVRERLRPVLREARDRGAFVNFDMEQYAFKDATLQVFEDVLDEPAFRDWPDVGIAVQAYLRDAEGDLRRLRHWAERRGTCVSVRLVKGAYWDYETIMAAQLGWPTPVWSYKWESDAAYERSTRFLLENRRWLRPAFASHNVRSLSYALALARVLGLPPGAMEIQMLYGMADPLKLVLARMGQRVRVYTPYGELLPGMAYLVRRLLENTANESFLRASIGGDVPVERLLRNPAEAGAARPAALTVP